MLGRGRKPYKQFGVLQGFRLSFPVIVILLICILIIAIYSARGNSPPVNSAGLLGNHLNNVGSSLVNSQLLNPNVEIVNGTELIWQIPDPPRAILFLAHGCGGRAGNFWDKSSSCPHCVGLPEERLIVINALTRNFAVLAISSVRKCWSVGMERVVIGDAIQWWIEKNGLTSVPLVAIGASSGGYFVSQLANDDELRFSSIVVMVAEGLFDQMEFPLSPSFLANRVPGLSPSVSESLHELFREKGFIDANGYMKEDGRQTPWVSALKESKIPFPYETISINHVQEELNLAFAYHEMTSLQSKEMFEWFESHIR